MALKVVISLHTRTQFPSICLNLLFYWGNLKMLERHDFEKDGQTTGFYKTATHIQFMDKYGESSLVAPFGL